MTTKWDIETDLIVVGSGAAGLTSALTASSCGLNVLVIEKASVYGGTTALSGGVIWVPNNSLMNEQGIEDSTDKAVTYLKYNVGNRVSETKLSKLALTAPKMLKHMMDNNFLEVTTFENFPDYNPESPGGLTQGGRSVEPKVFSGNRLGKVLKQMRKRPGLAPAGIVGTMTELRQLAEIRSNPKIFFKAWKVFPRNLWNKLANRSHLSTGASLIGWLRHGLIKMNIPLMLETKLNELVINDGRITGAIVETAGRSMGIKCSKGIVIAAGGFENNSAMRLEFLGQQPKKDYTSGSPENTGDGIEAGMQVGAALDMMDDAWWAPTFLSPENGPQIVIFERGKPGNIIVNSLGQRYANEADPYNELVKQMHESHRSVSSIPSYFIFDSVYRENYPIAGMLPGITPQRHIDSGFITQANSVADLAKQCDIPPDNLIATLDRFNQMAVDGKDKDFNRGESAFDKFSGDLQIKPNPCLGPINQAPFYAIKLYPGDLGTKGGLLTNENAQVINNDGEPIEGLYAAGNSSSAVTGNFYPGAGGTIGPAMTYGYIAAMHASGKP